MGSQLADSISTVLDRLKLKKKLNWGENTAINYQLTGKYVSESHWNKSHNFFLWLPQKPKLQIAIVPGKQNSALLCNM